MMFANGATGTGSFVMSDEAFPAVHRPDSENAPQLLVRNTLVLVQRLLLRLWRDPLTIVQALLMPVFFLVTLNVVLGDTISSITGSDALYRSVPMVTLAGGVLGSSVGAIGLIRERGEGLLARLWVAPVHRASGLLSRIVAEAIRVLVTALVILAVGMMLGMRLERGLLAGLAWLCVPVVFGLAIACLVTTVALFWANTTLVEAITVVNTLGVLFCTGFVPLDQYPKWIQPVVEHQPMTYAVEAMRGLSLDGPVLSPVIGTLLWFSGTIAACAVPMVYGYRRAGTSR
jgi:ABC-2 type transport system permease protein